MPTLFCLKKKGEPSSSKISNEISKNKGETSNKINKAIILFSMLT